MKSKMLGALALLTLIGALFVMQSADQHTPTADAATGSIAALNVGTCLTTDGTVFKGDCDGLSGGSGSDRWEIRDKIAEVSTLYATYAHDPKTQSDAPRAILMDSDLLKISIADSDRDKRSPILVKTNPSDRGAVRISGTSGDLRNADDDDALAEIRELLAADSGVSIIGSDNTGDVTVKQNMFLDSADAVRGDSGNETLNFSGSAAATDPMDVKGNIRFFGCTVRSGRLCGVDGGNGVIAEHELQDVSGSIEVDEDASSGENSDKDVAPWLGVNASVPADKDILIYAIYFETSSEENLVGGHEYHDCAINDHSLEDRGGATGWKCDPPGNVDDDDVDTTPKDGEFDVVYTSNEKNRNQALMVRASADGDLDDRSVNLYLTETGRFDGVYQGYLRLTDANGDGSDMGNNRTDWGREVMGGAGDPMDMKATKETAAVLAVESGPVTIEYRDTNGTSQRLRIEIDKTPPMVTVTSPSHGSSSGDQTPDFAGTLEDIDSGLADESFRLVVDNQVEQRDGKNNDFALNGKAPNAADVTGPATGLTRIAEYEGYSDTNPLFGIVPMASDLYDLDDDQCRDGEANCYIEAEAYDDGATSGTFDDSLRLDLYDGTSDFTIRDREFDIDFQAFVMDMAGNIGFSDSDPSNPRYINDLGAEASKRKPGNVLGYYSAHIMTLDEKDPEIMTGQSATGYYGLNSNNDPIMDRSGVMVVFDGPISVPSVTTDTFTVELDDGMAANIIDAHAVKNFAFLKLDAELASDATPEIDIMHGEKVEDMAGNETFGQEVPAFDLNDGISPKLTVSLGGGSGSGTENEGPGKLTKEQITINVSSDEALQGAPRIAVVCSTLTWNEGKDARVGSSDLIGKDIDDFIANRNGAFPNQPSDNPVMTSPKAGASGDAYEYTCGYDSKPADKFADRYMVDDVSALSRPGENWDYTWKKNGRHEDGMLTVVVFGRDRSRFDNIGATDKVQNWGSSSAEFMLDTKLASPLDGGGEVQPADGGTSKEARPFVLIKFTETTSVTLESVELDDVEITSEFTEPEANQFVYWPLTLVRGDHEVAVEAVDAAGNPQDFEFSFTVEERGDFLLNLLAGWNAVSVPADPVDTSIGAVFTDPAIDTVIGWDTEGWRIAVRRDGVWESNHQYGTLNEIRSKYGYWVKSNNFVRQPIALTANDRGVGGPRSPISIDTKAGWNFVGVIDQDGDQTEGDSGNGLKDSDDKPVTAAEYLGSDYVRAYTWDATFNRFDVLRENHQMEIGDGVWVYYQGGIAP